jgi:hypothetical protein
MERHERIFTIGLRRVSKVLVANEPWSEPESQPLESALRPYALRDFNGETISARCKVGSEEPEIAGHTPDDLLRVQLRWLAAQGAREMAEIMARVTGTDYRAIAVKLIEEMDPTLPFPSSEDEIEVNDSPVTLVETAVGLRAGAIMSGKSGVRLVLPGYPRNVSLHAFGNALIRQRMAEAIRAALAEHSLDAD